MLNATSQLFACRDQGIIAMAQSGQKGEERRQGGGEISSIKSQEIKKHFSSRSGVLNDTGGWIAITVVEIQTFSPSALWPAALIH